MTSDALDDLFIFSPVYFTTQPNRSTEVIVPLSFDLQDNAQVVGFNLCPIYKTRRILDLEDWLPSATISASARSGGGSVIDGPFQREYSRRR